MSCCSHIGCGLRSPERHSFSLPARPQTRRRSTSLPPRHSAHRTLSPSLVLPPPSQNDALITQVAAQSSLIFDDSDYEGDREGRGDSGSPGNTYATNFGALRTLLIRRLYQKAYSKKDPYHTVGNSKEELARRAELKRARRKRIEQELHQDGHKNKDKHKEAQKAAITSETLAIVGPRDNLEFDVWLQTDTRTPDHGPVTGAVQTQVAAHNDGDVVDKAHRRRSSCPPTPMSLALLPDHNVSLRGQISLPQISSMTVRNSDSLFNSIVATESSQYSMPDLVPVLFGDSQEGSNQPLEKWPEPSTTELEEASKYRTPQLGEAVSEQSLVDSHKVPIIVTIHPDATHPGDISMPLLDNDTFQSFLSEDSPLDTWLRTQGIQPLSLCSKKTSDSAMSGQQIGSQSVSSKESIDSKLHALPLKQRSHNRVKLFPSPISHKPHERLPSHLILSPGGLQHGSLDIYHDPAQPSDASRCGSSNYATRPNSNDSSLRAVIAEQGHPWTVDKDRPNESRSSSYQTAFTSVDHARRIDRGPSQRWWELSRTPTPVDQDTASIKHREIELLSVATRFNNPRTALKTSAPTTGKFHKDIATSRMGKENKSPVLSLIQSMLAPVSQKKKSTSEDLRLNHVVTERSPKPRIIMKPPTPGYIFTCGSISPQPKKSSWQKIVIAGKMGLCRRTTATQALNHNTDAPCNGQTAGYVNSASWPAQNGLNESSCQTTAGPSSLMSGAAVLVGEDVATKNATGILPHSCAHNTCSVTTDQSNIATDEDIPRLSLCVKVSKFLDGPKKSASRHTPIIEADFRARTPKAQSLHEDYALQDAQQDIGWGDFGLAETLKRSKSYIECGASRREARPDKFMTWHGAPSRQRIFFDSTLEFSDQLEQALADAKLMALQ